MKALSRSVALILVGAGVALLSVWLFRAKPRAVRAKDAVPPDAFVAVAIDVGSLRASGALRALFGASDEQSVTKLCGFDPVDRMQSLVFTVPEGGDGIFGVAVDADVSKDDLVRCADAVVRSRGGDPTSDVDAYDTYEVMTPHRGSADAKTPARSLAYLGRGPILVGQKEWLHRMIDALASVRDGRGSPGEHETLRAHLASSISPPPSFLATATVLLDKSVREKIRGEMTAEVGPGDEAGSAMMLGVLGVSSAVVGLFERGHEVHAVGSLRCEEEPQCALVEKLILKVRGEWSKAPGVRALGLGPVVDHLEVDRHGTELSLRTSAATTDVIGWAKLFLEPHPSPRPAAITPRAPTP